MNGKSARMTLWKSEMTVVDRENVIVDIEMLFFKN